MFEVVGGHRELPIGGHHSVASFRARTESTERAEPAFWDAEGPWICPLVLGQVRAEPGQLRLSVDGRGSYPSAVSGTVFISYRGRGFWSTSSETMILIAAMLEEFDGREDLRWLHETAEQWRAQACVRDFGLQTDDSWTEDELSDVLDLVVAAAGGLRSRRQLAPEELNSWILLDGMHVDDAMTFDAVVPVAPVLDVADALTKLLTDRLPADPSGGWWFYGNTHGTKMIQRREQPSAPSR